MFFGGMRGREALKDSTFLYRCCCLNESLLGWIYFTNTDLFLLFLLPKLCSVLCTLFVIFFSSSTLRTNSLPVSLFRLVLRVE